jgi:murein DD-endopeptidase MepM/ murein hydrolase activator NlpD
MKVGCVKSNCEGPYHGYWAIDFETLLNKPGAPVYAAGAGRVRIDSQGTGRCGGPGTVANSLIVNHGGGVESVYVHLNDFAVADGAWVTPNTIIGHVGSSGYTDPCPDYHLHFEVRVNGASVNPGQLRACQASKLVTYPSAVGFADWNAIPAQEYAGGPLSPRGRTVYSDGTACASS